MSRALQEAAHPESPAYARTDGQATPEVRRRDGADPRRWRALAVTQLAAFMVLLDVSIVNVALPSIERDLAVSTMTAQWVISGYGLAVGLALVPAGRLGDSLGRRRMFLIALTAFVRTSALTGAAPSAGLLIAARLVQGVAGGMLIPQNSGLIQELFQGAERPGVRNPGFDDWPRHGGRASDRRADPGNSRPRRLALGVLRECANRRHRVAASDPAPACYHEGGLARYPP